MPRPSNSLSLYLSPSSCLSSHIYVTDISRDDVLAWSSQLFKRIKMKLLICGNYELNVCAPHTPSILLLFFSFPSLFSFWASLASLMCQHAETLSRRVVELFRDNFSSTAALGSEVALRRCYDFGVGADHVLVHALPAAELHAISAHFQVPCPEALRRFSTRASRVRVGRLGRTARLRHVHKHRSWCSLLRSPCSTSCARSGSSATLCMPPPSLSTTSACVGVSACLGRAWPSHVGHIGRCV